MPSHGATDSALPRIFLTQSPYTPPAGGGNPVRLSQLAREAYERGGRTPFPLVASAAKADLVVLWEEYQAGEQTLAPKLRAAATAVGDPDKVFVVATEDRPAGFLPGVYCSTPLVGPDERRFRTGAYFHTMNPLLAQAAESRRREPRLLFSFIGAGTAPVRREIFRRFKSDALHYIQETGNLQYNINVEDPAKRPGQKSYAETTLDSLFVLCPRGGGHSSFRLFETMQLGRVPVILSDPWVAPRGPCWQDFSIRVAEKHVDRLDEILTSHMPFARAMGEVARTEWEAWFRPDILPFRSFQWIYDLFLTRTHSEVDYVRGWDRLAWRSQWPPPLPIRARNKIARLLTRKQRED